MNVFAKHHYLPHFHESESYHRAHAISKSALFFYLQILVIITVAYYFVKPSTSQILGEAIFSAEKIVELTNTERQKENLPTLSSNPLLIAAAKAKSEDMHANDYWSHNSPSGKTPWNFIVAADYKYLFAGENLARDFDKPEDVVRAWMNSPTHRSNILDKNYREIGVYVESGKISGREGILVVQMFGATSSAILAQNNTPKAEVDNIAKKTEKIEEPKNIVDAPIILGAVKSFSFAKGASLTLVSFIFLLFVIESLVVMRSAKMTLNMGVIGHLFLLLIVMAALWYSVAGTIV